MQEDDIIAKINIDNYKLINGSINKKLKFEFEETDLDWILTFDIREVYDYYGESKKIDIDIKNLNGEINNYTSDVISRDEFINNIEPNIKEIENKSKRIFHFNSNYFNKIIRQQTGVVISGPGGIGKSYYIYTITEKLKEKGINYLTIYGKWYDSSYIEAFDYIKDNYKDQRFIIIIDAINELNEADRTLIIKKLEELQNLPRLSIVLTYRDNTIDISCLDSLKLCHRLFEGVNYKSAVEELIELTGSNVFEYDEILRTNNSLYLTILYRILQNGELRSKDSIISITHVLESYIKDKKCCTPRAWKFVKLIADKMFHKGSKYLTEE